MAAAKIATMRQGARTDLQPSANLPEVSQATAAEMLNVSERTLRHAREVRDRGAPELQSAVERRHLDESQRAIAAAKIAQWRVGDNQYTGSANLPTQTAAAEMLNVSERTLRHAREVRDRGAPELISAVERGEVSVFAASAPSAGSARRSASRKTRAT